MVFHFTSGQTEDVKYKCQVMRCSLIPARSRSALRIVTFHFMSTFWGNEGAFDNGTAIQMLPSNKNVGETVALVDL